MSDFKSINSYGQELSGYATVDKPWERFHPKDSCNLNNFPQMTAYDYLVNENKNYMDDFALGYVYGDDITYRQLFALVDKVAKSLKELGIEKGDFVTMGPLNLPEYVATFLAISKIGAVANMIAPTWTHEQMVERIAETKSKHMIVVDRIHSRYEKAINELEMKNIVVISPLDSMSKEVKLGELKKHPIRTIKSILKPEFITPKDNRYIKWHDFINNNVYSNKNTYEPWEPRRPLIMVYSSGSTGPSKGIVLPNESFTAMVHSHKVSNMKFTRGNIIFTIIPPFFSTSVNTCLYLPLGLGVKTILQPAISPETFAGGLARYNPHYAVVSPSLWASAVGHPSLKNADLSNGIYYITAGERLHPRLAEALKNEFKSHGFKGVMDSGYGQCEGGAGFSNTIDSGFIPGSSGKPYPGVTMGIFDIDTDEELKYNQRGRLRAYTPMRMNEYFNNSEATSKYFDRGVDELVDTGDYAYIDEDGNLFSEGRISDSIIDSSGKRLQLGDIEEVLFQEESCIDSMQPEASGISVNNESKKVIVAHIAIKPQFYGTETEILKRIDKLCIEKLSSLSKDAIPVGYKFIQGFTIASNGKRDTSPFKNDREGYYKPDENGKIIKINFPEAGEYKTEFIDNVPNTVGGIVRVDN